MEPGRRGPSAGTDRLLTHFRSLAEQGDAKAMTTLAGLLMNHAVDMQDASLLDDAERWFLAAAAKDEQQAKSFVDEAWPEAKAFYRDQIAPRAG